jgi:hypothetical protein
VNARYVEGCPYHLPLRRQSHHPRRLHGRAAPTHSAPDPRRWRAPAGARQSLSSTSRSYGLTPTLSGAAVYEFLPDWHLKLNYAVGLPAAGLQQHRHQWRRPSPSTARSDLKVETSRSGQVEVNARLLKGKRRIRELDLRADYS